MLGIINKEYNYRILPDTRYTSYIVIAECFAQKLQLEQIKIKPIYLENYTSVIGSVILTIT
jgi:predicted aspartyl protease